MGRTAEAAGRLLASWITSSPARFYFYYDGTYTDPKYFVQLFVEAATGTEPDISRTAEELIEASGYEIDYFRRGTAETPDSDFNLALFVERNVIEMALAAVAIEDPVYADMLTAAEIPPEARARDERVDALRKEFPL